MKEPSERGFIALITAILLGVILMMAALSLSTTGYFTRGQVLDAEYKEHSRSFAEACLNIAQLRLAVLNPSNFSETTGGSSCYVGNIFIDPVHCAASQFLVNVVSAFPATTTYNQSAYTYLQACVKDISNNLSIASWKECPTIPPC